MFDYINSSGIDKFTFYRVPKILFTDDKFHTLSCEAKILYGLLLDRATLSKQKKWIDEQDRVYVYFKQDEAMKLLSIRKNKVIAIFKELEGIGLIIRKKVGQGNPTKIYVMNFSEDSPVDESNSADENDGDFQTSAENNKINVLTFEKQTSENSEAQTSTENSKINVLTFEKQTSKGLKNKHLASDYINKTELYDTESIHQSDGAPKPTSDLSPAPCDKTIDEIDYPSTAHKVKLQISYDLLLSKGKEQSTLDLIVSLIAEIFCKKQSSIFVNGIDVPAECVAKEFSKLECEHIEYVFECLEAATAEHKIKNIRKYLLTCLYNAPHSMDLYYDTQANYDMHKQFTTQD